MVSIIIVFYFDPVVPLPTTPLGALEFTFQILTTAGEWSMLGEQTSFSTILSAHIKPLKIQLPSH